MARVHYVCLCVYVCKYVYIEYQSGLINRSGESYYYWLVGGVTVSKPWIAGGGGG